MIDYNLTVFTILRRHTISRQKKPIQLSSNNRLTYMRNIMLLTFSEIVKMRKIQVFICRTFINALVLSLLRASSLNQSQ